MPCFGSFFVRARPLVLLLGVSLVACQAPEAFVPRTMNDAAVDALPVDGATVDASPHDATRESRDGGARLEQEGSAPDAEISDDGLKVTLSTGAVQGKLTGSTREFLGVPYGLPPTGERRFAPPRPAAAWQGVRDARRFGNDCMQPDMPGTIPKLALPRSEDCLVLNVWAPQHPTDNPAPVFVHILSGAWIYGGGADLDGRLLSEATGAIVVAPNFRQGALSFLTHPELDDVLDRPSGNQSIRDQQLALQWVQDNIEAFGGDPSAVTLYGQSAGAQSACVHWFSPGSRALVQRYVLQSGSCVDYRNVPLRRAGVANTSAKLVAELCKDRGDTVACLRELPAEAIASWGVGQFPAVGEGFMPQVDGDVLPRSPKQAFAAGELNPAPILLGSVPNEWAVVVLYGGAEVPHPKSILELWFYLSLFFADGTSEVIARYAPLGTPDAQADAILANVMSDMMFHCPARALARRASAAGTPVYLYSFELAPAVHGLDVDYLFGYPWVSPLLKPPLFVDAAPVPLLTSLVSALQGYVGSFTATGDPNHPGLPTWPRYQQATDAHLSLSGDISAGRGLSAASCDFWDAWHAKWDFAD